MPASMMSEATGSNENVIGSSSATVAVGPMPGSTPTAVPRVTPSRQIRMLEGWRATSSPRASPEKSMSAAQPGAEDRQPQLEQADEDAQAECRQADRDDQGPDGTGAVPGQGGDE